MLFLALAAAAAAPQPGALKTFGDWTVGCDNGRACQAVALVPDAADRDGYLLLVLFRDGEPAAAPTLRVPLDRVTRGTTVTLSIDGKPVARLVAPGGDGGLQLPFDRKLYAALAQGRTATLTGAGGRRSASLSGAAAAMLYIDDQQHRLGTREALVRTGVVTVAPAPPALPVVVQPAPGDRPPHRLSVKNTTRLIGPDNAVCEAARPVVPDAARLDAAHSVVTVVRPCGNGAYNQFTSVFIVDERGRATPAPLDAPAGMGERPTNTVTNGGWDTATRRLTSFARGRGLGDCGTIQSFAWDGAAFRLVEQRAMGECRGSTDFITTWRARVVTR